MVILIRESATKTPGYVNSSFGGFDLIVHEQTGFFNATKLCLQAGKHLTAFVRSNNCHTLDKLLNEMYGTLFFTTSSNGIPNVSPIAGTYYHPVMFLAVAMWCSNQFYVNAALIVNDFFNKTAERRKRFKQIMTIDNENTCFVTEVLNPVFDIRRVRYAGFDLIVDKHNWFNATNYCIQNGKKIEGFVKYKNITNLISYVRDIFNMEPTRNSNIMSKKDAAFGMYYHPVLFLRLASWISPEFYAKASRIVLAHYSGDDARLKEIAIEERDAGNTDEVFEIKLQNVENLESKSKLVDEQKEETLNDTGLIKLDRLYTEEEVAPILQKCSVLENEKREIKECLTREYNEKLRTMQQQFAERTEEEKRCITRQFNRIIRNKRNEIAERTEEDKRRATRELKETLTTERKRFEEERSASENTLKQAYEEIQRFEEERRASEDKLKRAHEEIERVEVERRVSEDKLKSAQEDIDRFELERRALENKLQRAHEEIERVEVERRDSENKLKRAHEEIEATKMELENAKSTRRHRLEESKRRSEQATPPKRSRREEIEKMAYSQGVERVESFMLVRFSEAGAYYVSRRQCVSLMSWLVDNKFKMDGVACWFITDNAVRDYNRVKSYFSDENSSLHPFVVSYKSNLITIDKERDEEFEEAARNEFRAMGLIEADENRLNVLLGLRHVPSEGDETTLPTFCSTSMLLTNVYELMKFDHDRNINRKRRTNLETLFRSIVESKSGVNESR